jgi:hypothetical protein
VGRAFFDPPFLPLTHIQNEHINMYKINKSVGRLSLVGWVKAVIKSTNAINGLFTKLTRIIIKSQQKRCPSFFWTTNNDPIALLHCCYLISFLVRVSYRF